MDILGIDTSCDDTSAAVVRDGTAVLSNVVASQASIHARWGGIVPEIACRAHLESLLPVVEEALARAGTTLEAIDAVAVTTRPGLVGALLVGIAAAKAIAFASGKPLVAVDHIEGHMHANRLDAPDLAPPYISMIVSGGHSQIFLYRGPGSYELLGETQDDAAGEAFDKVAALLGLPYPGGPAIERAAEGGDPAAVRFPRSMLGADSLDMSFSGLKTSVLYHLKGQDARRGGLGWRAGLEDAERAAIAASFQEAVVDALVAKARRAVRRTGLRTVAVGGGVACNSRLREKMQSAAAKGRFRVHFPPRELCTDNAAMIASLAHANLAAGRGVGLDADAVDTRSNRLDRAAGAPA
jgi:N6-L-threonylcarbamoyladenine synthase